MKPELEQTMNNILSDRTIAKVQDILMEQLGVERAQITPEAGIMADLGADSLDMIEIAMKVEETSNLTFPDEEMDQNWTVEDLYEALGRHLENTGQPV